jgi:hypothetical protein
MSVEDDDEVTDFQNYQDIRMELNSTGHNLVRTYAYGCVCCGLFIAYLTYPADIGSDQPAGELT